MHYSVKRAGSKIRAIFLCFAMLAACLCLPHSAYASQLTLDVEPYIYFTYKSTNDGTQVKGDTLVAGTYDVSIVLEGLDSLCDMQITVDYTEDAVVESDPVSLLSDGSADITSMGYAIGDGRIVFGFVSDMDNYSDIDPTGTVLATFRATFAADHTAEQMREIFVVTTNPNTTFIQVNYADNEDDIYALDALYADYNGNIYPMSCDVFPVAKDESFTVTGKITISSDPSGSDSGYGLGGVIVELVDSAGNTVSSYTTDSNGSYTLNDVPAGDYTIKVHGDSNSVYGNTLVPRNVNLTVAASGTLANIGVVMCDYNTDKNIDTTDLTTFLSSYSGDYNPYCDFNADKSVDTTDFTSFLSFYGKDTVYDELKLSVNS